MRKILCANEKCASLHIHHENVDDDYGKHRTVEVEDGWEGENAFCSIICAVYAGKFSVNKKGVSEE